MSLVILIDLDDTLTDRSAAFDAWALRFLTAHDQPVDELGHLRELDRRGVCPREEFFALASAHLGLGLDISTELAAYRATTATPPLHQGVRERLSAMRAHGGIVVVLTNGFAATQRRKLVSTGMLNSLDDVIISEEVGLAKPDPRVYRLALDRVGASTARDEVWMVGDNPETDIKGALASGLHAAWVSPMGAGWQDLPRPDLILPSTAACLDKIVSGSVASLGDC